MNMPRISGYLALCLAVLLLHGCSDHPSSDAYGNFEATETIVSAEGNGRIIEITATEGEALAEGLVAVVIDTTQLHLQAEEIDAQILGRKAGKKTLASQIAVLEQRKKNAARDKARFERLFRQRAVARKQLDDITDSYRVIEKEIDAAATENRSIDEEIKALGARKKEVEDMISRSLVRNPVEGIVLVRYAEPGEVVAYGQPLYKIADLNRMYLRAYVDGTQLPDITTGQKVTVLFDRDRTTNRAIEGTIFWISSKAEFTPKIIQTKEDRVNLVYAVKISVPNDGALKIGMPGEVRFNIE